MSIEYSFMTAIGGLSSKVAIDGIYYLLRLIRHKGLFRKVDSLIAHGAANEPSQEAASVAFKLLRLIEDEEKADIQSLKPEKIQQLVHFMDKAVTEIYEKDIRVQPKDGVELLEQMRKSKI